MTTVGQQIASQANANVNQNVFGTIIYNSKAYGSKADGLTNDAAAIQSAITAATPNGGIIMFPPGTYKVSAALTFPANVTLWIANGAKFSIDTGITVTINGPLQVGVHQIFSGLGTVVFNHAITTVGYPEWWGAVPGGADCLAAINACIVALPVTQLQRADYIISNTLVINTPHRTLQGVDEQYNDANANKGTRIIVQSSTADVILIGLSANPGNVNNFLKQVSIRHICVTRDRTVTPPASGSEINGAAGIRLKFTLNTYIEYVRSHENTLGFCLDGTVRTEFTKCFAFRSIAGTVTTNDIFYGYFQNGNASIGLAGGNASTYYTDCTASVGGTPALSNSIGFNLSGKPVDTFLFRIETSFCNTGISISGDTSQTGNADVHVINPIIDVFNGDGILITGVGNYGAIEVLGGYFAPVSGSSTCFGMRVLNSTGMVTLTNNQVIGYLNTLAIGEWIDTSSGVVSRSNMFLGCLRNVIMMNSNNCVIEDIIHCPAQVATEAAVYLSGSNRNKIGPVVKGQAGAFPAGVRLNAAGNSFNEINCTGVDSGCITGGSTNKLQINSVAITATGLSGNNLVSGVMA